VEINRRRVDYIRTRQLKRAEEASQVTLESYNFGGSTLIDYLDAQRTYRDAVRIYNQALFDERISLYELSSSIALEPNNGTKQKNRIGSLPIVFIALMTGFVLGAFLYPELSATGPSTQSTTPQVESGESGELELSSDTVQIGPESQKEVGIAVESAAYRNLRDTLAATGTVSEDPSRVAHIRPLARGLIEKSYVRLGDRVSAGDPLVEYDNIELGVAIGEYLTAQAELQRSLTDLEVRKTILQRGKEMLKVGAIARTAYDLREAEHKDAEAKTDGARATVAKIEEQIHRFGWTDQDLANLPAKQRSGHTVTHSVLKAPFSGIITAYHASIGEAVESSTELLAITDMSSLWVLADIFEKTSPT
jgi:cobalt-zinc-cadmium efflux system membrane fusion protein